MAQLHEHALEAVGGLSSVLLMADGRTGTLRPASAAGLEQLPLHDWLSASGEAQAVEAAFGEDAPKIIADLADHMPELARRLGAGVAVLVPLVRQDQRVGVLIVGAPHSPSAPDWRDRLSAVGDAFVLAAERAAARRDLELRQQVQAAVLGLSRGIPADLGMTTALETFCHDANRLFMGQRTSFWLYDRRTRQLVLTASSDPAEMRRGGCVSTEDAIAPAALAVNRNSAEIGPSLPEIDPTRTTWTITVPLRGLRRTLGALVAEGIPMDPGTELVLVERADELGRQLSAAVENVLLLDNVTRARREIENVFNSIPDLVVVCDTRLFVTGVNATFARRVDVPSKEIIERPLADFVSRETAEWIESLGPADVGGARGTRQVEDEALQGTFVVTVTPLLSEARSPTGCVIVARDVAAQLHLEAERATLRDHLHQSEKLAALGQLVAGIAHELNNPLQGVLGHLELLRATGAFPVALRREMRTVYREANRAARIVRNLLVFARSRRLSRRRVSLNATMGRVLALRRKALASARIQVVRRFNQRLPQVIGDGVLLQQALLNIVLNAEHAVAGRRVRRLWVTTSRARSAGWIRVTVRDTGGGVPADALPRIFEPFFTTKEVGEGTGLGLAMTHAIVHEHGGTIHARNTGSGASFTIELPGDRHAGKVKTRHD